MEKKDRNGCGGLAHGCGGFVNGCGGYANGCGGHGDKNGSASDGAAKMAGTPSAAVRRAWQAARVVFA